MDDMELQKKLAQDTLFDVRSQLRQLMMNKNISNERTDDINLMWEQAHPKPQKNQPTFTPPPKRFVYSPQKLNPLPVNKTLQTQSTLVPISFTKDSNSQRQFQDKFETIYNPSQATIKDVKESILTNNNLLSFLVEQEQENVVCNESSDKIQNNTTMNQNTTIVNNTMHMNLSQFSGLDILVKEENIIQSNRLSQSPDILGSELLRNSTNRPNFYTENYYIKNQEFNSQQPQLKPILPMSRQSVSENDQQYTKHGAILQQVPKILSQRNTSQEETQRPEHKKQDLNQLLFNIQDIVQKQQYSIKPKN